MNTNESLEARFHAVCEKTGWKATVQRFAVFKAIQGNTEHPSIERMRQKVSETVPNISTESVHRILKDFEDAGLIQELGAMERVRFDCNPAPHYHFVCKDCGTIIDLPATTDYTATALPPECGDKNHMEMRLVGLCKSCADKRVRKCL